MTLAFSWATNTNYSTGPDVSTPTKVDPASTANGFIAGTVAAPQHINFLFDAVGDQIVKAIDGVGGGTYTLGSALRFEGADVQIAADLEVVSGGEINVNAGGQINVDSGAQVDIAGEINVLTGGDIDVESGAQIDIESGGVLNVLGGGDINVASSGQINVAGGGEVNLAASSFIAIASSASIEVSGIVNVNNGGVQNVNSGGRIDVESGGAIDVNAGGSITLEDQNDLVINDDTVNARLSLTPTWIESVTGTLTWDRTAAAPGGALIQTQVDATDQYLAMFPLVLPPGDDVLGLTAILHGTIGSAAAHADLPGLMPAISVISVDSAGAQTTITAAAAPNDGVDASASQAAYDANHTVVWVPAATLTISGANAYYVILRGEAGSDSQADSLGLRSITAQVTARSFRGTGSTNILP